MSPPLTAPATTPPTTTHTRGGHVGMVLLLGALTALGPFTIDMYLPALPTIGHDLLTSDAAIQLTLTGTLLGLAVGQLLIGPLSDVLGRRAPLLVGVAVHVLASLLCVFAPNIVVLGAMRVLQGIGAAAATVVAMAVVRDLYSGRAAATMISRLTLVLGVSPVLAPTIGGQLMQVTSWRGVFAVLMLIGAALLVVAALALPETLPVQRRRSAGIGSVLRTYEGLLRDRVFVGLVLVVGFLMAAVFSYISGSPFVFQQEFGLDEAQFGLLFGSCAVFLIGASQLNVALLRTWQPRQMLFVGLVGALVGALVLVAAAVAHFGGLFGVLVPLWVTVLFIGLAMPNAPAMALSRHGNAAGTAAAMVGAFQFGIGALASPLVGTLGNNAVAMGVTMAGSLAVSLLLLVVVVRPWQLAAEA